ncbi:uncharacterized protein LOC118191232 [Stegodyphus dumicola]|uniref:uncharacterized protein LOC118191232 n=1 Tax=Stegodyphus dumicola TaxID=202533 RepID=UPI0015B139E9|nr:uncharacterized protein LOC118191232 [Stegodyphus dumicola]
MKYLIILLLVVVAVTGQKGKPLGKGYGRPPVRFVPAAFPRGSVSRDVYAASLGGAPVGLYGKSSGLGRGFGTGFGNSDVSGAALGGAKVGLYGKERPGQKVIG